MKCSNGHEFNCPMITAYAEPPYSTNTWSTAPATVVTTSFTGPVPIVRIVVRCPVCAGEVPQ